MLSRKEFATQNWNAAVNATKGTGIFPQTLMAISIVESQGKAPDGNWYPGYGTPARIANNYYGIKKGSNWEGETVRIATPNDADAVSIFRKYPSYEASTKDFVKFLQVNPRYKNAGVFRAENYTDQIFAIARAGYSESPTYTNIISSVANTINNYVKNLSNQPIDKVVKKTSPIVLIGLLIVYLIGTSSNKKSHAN